MTRKSFAMAAVTATLLFSCTKQAPRQSGAAIETPPAAGARTAPINPAPAAACTPGYFSLEVDATARGRVYRVLGMASLGAPTVTAIIGSAGNNVIGSSLAATTVTQLTGLAYDPATVTGWAVTGNAGSHPNSLIRFNMADPNVVLSITPFANPCGLALNISDIERDPASGQYYAINRGTAGANNRIVTINTATATVNCLPNFLVTSTTMRGLTFGCNAQLYVFYAIGSSGRILEISKVTGLQTGAWSYPGTVTPGGAGAPEMGLHLDCACTGRFITANFTGASLLTDGLPSGLGGPLYASLPSVLKPTVDFARR